jgi:hypothetical protein
VCRVSRTDAGIFCGGKTRPWPEACCALCSNSGVMDDMGEDAGTLAGLSIPFPLGFVPDGEGLPDLIENGVVTPPGHLLKRHCQPLRGFFTGRITSESPSMLMSTSSGNPVFSRNRLGMRMPRELPILTTRVFMVRCLRVLTM